jgi:hypothetical protein
MSALPWAGGSTGSGLYPTVPAMRVVSQLWLLPTQNRKLMPQNKQFDVLGERAAAVPDQQSQQCRKPELGKGEEHPPMLPEPGPSPPIEATRGFETPHPHPRCSDLTGADSLRAQAAQTRLPPRFAYFVGGLRHGTGWRSRWLP